MGILSGSISATLTNPLDVVNNRLMTMPNIYNGIIKSFSKVIKKEGLTSLFSGVMPRIISLAPLTGITFAIYEKLNQLIDKALKK